MKTYNVTAKEIEREWYLFDATDQVLGRLASRVATMLRGKHKPIYTPHLDTGDNVIIINADKVILTGRKAEQKLYHRHSGYPGGIKTISYSDLMAKKPIRVITTAVKGMLPKNRLGKAMLAKLKVYPGNEHPHQAQQPKELK
ncbi:MAG: 50S ribosomal protein L13 [Endomicrobiia bacterium]|nr:50S ribosomal protein L13 [Endomicrobiia bacterium]